VRLYLNNQPAGDTFVSTQEEWRFTPAEDLPPGSYVARAVAVNPQGAIMAESAPVAFVVLESTLGARDAPPDSSSEPLRAASSLPDSEPGREPGSEPESELMPIAHLNRYLNGTATLQCSVAAFLGSIPLAVTHANTDETRAMTPALQEDAGMQLAVSTHVDEPVALVDLEGERVPPVYAPVLLSPLSGRLAGGNPPVIVGSALPHSEVMVAVNGQIAARLRADQSGQWAFRPVNALPAGEHRLTIFARGEENGRLTQASVVVEVR
jgi:hypothetical protein